MARIKIPDNMLHKLRQLRENSGVGPMRLLRSRDDVPGGLDSGHVSAWLSGTRKYADDTHLEYVLEIWPQADPLLDVTDEMVDQLQSELSRTQIQLTSMAKRLQSYGHKTDKNALSMLRRGKRSVVSKSLWQALLEALASFPDVKDYPAPRKTQKPKAERKVQPYISGTGLKPKPTRSPTYKSNFADDYALLLDSDRESLLNERERTGVGAIALLRTFGAEKPEKLSKTTISSWINGHAKYASQSRLAWVLHKWRSLPDK